MENTKQTVQEMREELVNHFKYLGEIREACNPEHLESLTDAMLKIYDVLSNDNNNERELYCFKEERGESIEKPLEHGEGGLREQAPEHLPNWSERTIVYQDEKEEQAPKCLTDLINSFAKKLDKEVSKGESSLVVIEI
ncbi:hypothetical protein QTH09_00180 [Clostridium perfringens]|nr:hypothetical protein [Clostridium perfringens]